MSGMVPYRRRMSRRVSAGRHYKMTEKRGTSSVAALVMARAMQQLAQENGDQEMGQEAKEYESLALAAIKLHLPELPEKPAAFQLRFPGF
jgi:hypothetical protein